MLPAHQAVVIPPPVLPPPGGRRGRAAGLWCGGWHESSTELRRGLQVIEHEWPLDSDCELLMDLVSFE